MPFDGLAIRALTRELNLDLADSRIDKIHQPEKDELVFSIRHTQKGNIRLVISANPRWARIHTSSEKKTNPNQPPSFCMLLRKYLEGGKIKEISQVGMERIVHIRIEALNDFKEWTDKLLVCEFMGRHSNIILLNPENGVILDSIKKISSNMSSFRQVLPGKEYLSPPTQGKIDPMRSSFQDFTTGMWNQEGNTTTASALFGIYTGISNYSAREICLAAGIDSNLPVEQCGDYELSQLYNFTQALISNIDQGIIQPVVQFKKNLPLEFSPFQPFSLFPGAVAKEFSSMNEACDSYYSKKLSQLRLESMQANLSRTIKEHLGKAYRKQFLQEGDLSQAKVNEKYRVWGELLTSYAYLYKKGDTLAVLDDFYTGEKLILDLDLRFTPIQNAQRYFKIYNKSRGAQKHLQRLMAENQLGIDYLESLLVAVNQAQSPAQIEEIVEEMEKEGYLKARLTKGKGKKKTERSQPRRFVSTDGMDILVGRNGLQNDRLTLKDSDRHDLWLHTKGIPGTHVIVSLPISFKSIDDIPDRTLEEAATLAAYFSKASDSQKVPVDYTFRSNVKKPGGARPGMVIYDNYWTIMVNPGSEVLQRLLDTEVIS